MAKAAKKKTAKKKTVKKKTTKKKAVKKTPPVELNQPTLVKGQFGEVVGVKLNIPKIRKKKAVKKKK